MSNGLGLTGHKGEKFLVKYEGAEEYLEIQVERHNSEIVKLRFVGPKYRVIRPERNNDRIKKLIQGIINENSNDKEI